MTGSCSPTDEDADMLSVGFGLWLWEDEVGVVVFEVTALDFISFPSVKEHFKIYPICL